MKTIKEWFESVEDEQLRSELLEMKGCFDGEVVSLADAIKCGFVWSSTKQGLTYWHNIHFELSKSNNPQ